MSKLTSIHTSITYVLVMISNIIQFEN